MKYFKLMKRHVDVEPFLDEISQHPDPWNLSVGRQSKIKVQRESQSIPLRGLVKSKIQGRKRWDVHESRYTTTSRDFPLAVSFINSFAAECDAQLGRAKIVNLPGGGRVYPHVDRGEYYRIRDRYHLILSSENGSYLKSGDEAVTMRTGELWWFDNKAVHEAHNESGADRIHLIFDLRPVSRERAESDQSRSAPAMAS